MPHPYQIDTAEKLIGPSNWRTVDEMPLRFIAMLVMLRMRHDGIHTPPPLPGLTLAQSVLVGLSERTLDEVTLAANEAAAWLRTAELPEDQAKAIAVAYLDESDELDRREERQQRRAKLKVHQGGGRGYCITCPGTPLEGDVRCADCAAKVADTKGGAK